VDDRARLALADLIRATVSADLDELHAHLARLDRLSGLAEGPRERGPSAASLDALAGR
jgi:hypothetical protein